MKLTKYIMMAALCGGLLSTANAADIQAYLTGSTAFRLQVFNSLSAMGLTANGANNASKFTFSGVVGTGYGTLSGKNIEVYCSWSGSAQGISDVIAGTVLTYNATSGGGSVTHTADYALSDVFQSSTLFTTPALVGAEAVSGKPGIAVQPFTWAANKNAIDAGVNNMTTKIADGLLANGVWPLSFWTGNPVHVDTLVNVTGRDSGSGTRITTLAETGYGIFTSVQQRFVNGANVWTDQPFNGGHSSGGLVRADLNNTASGEPGVGYLGLGDASSLLPATAGKCIAWHGVNIWVGPAANAFNLALVKNGVYSFWGYEHMYRKSTTGGDLVAIFQPGFLIALDNELSTSTTAVRVADMNVFRNEDGGPILPN